MLSKKNNQIQGCFKGGFTLLEILLVVGIIAILAGIVIIAINPGRQLAQARNTERKSDLKQINNALQQYYIDHGSYPASVLSSLTEICDTGSLSTTTGSDVDCTGLVDLSILVPTYLTAIPADPQALAVSSSTTSYKVVKYSSTGKIGLEAVLAEQNLVINIGIPPTYTVTYNGNNNTGGTAPVDSNEYENGNMATVLGNTGSLTKTNSIFSTWNTTAAGDGSDRAVGSTFTISSDVNLYAKWTADPCNHTATDTDCWSEVLGPMIWGPLGVVTNAQSATDGSGNTNILKNLAGSYPAADACANLTTGGYTWYLPARQQLYDALQARLSGFPTAYYWSSTESSSYPADGAWLVLSDFVWVSDLLKESEGNYVRCLR